MSNISIQAVYRQSKVTCKCHGVSGSCNLRTCWHQLPSFREVGDRLARRYSAAERVVFNRPGTSLVRAASSPSSSRAPDTEQQSARRRARKAKRRSRSSSSSSAAHRRAQRRLRRRRPRRTTVSRPAKDDLVFVESSPDYCEPNDVVGSLGTHGRRCERSTSSASGTARDRRQTGGGAAVAAVVGDEQSCEVLCCGRGYNSFKTTVSERCRCKFHWCCEVRCSICEHSLDVHVCK